MIMICFVDQLLRSTTGTAVVTQQQVCGPWAKSLVSKYPADPYLVTHASSRTAMTLEPVPHQEKRVIVFSSLEGLTGT